MAPYSSQWFYPGNDCYGLSLDATKLKHQINVDDKSYCNQATPDLSEKQSRHGSWTVTLKRNFTAYLKYKSTKWGRSRVGYNIIQFFLT